MKNLTYLFFVILVALIAACNKNQTPTLPIASVNVINAAVDLPQVSVNFTNTPVTYSQQHLVASYGSSVEYGTPAIQTPVLFFSSLDTTKAFYSGSLNLKDLGIYSLFVTGQVPHTDTLLLQDHIPVYQDSVAGVRFINLSPDSQPVSINLAGNYPGNADFQNLAYRKVTAFKSYPATSNISSYNFEVRDAATGTLLTTFTWNLFRFRCHTVVIDGLVNGIGGEAISAFSYNNF